MNDKQDFMSLYDRYRAAIRTANDVNKIVLFDALAATAATRIVACFNGEGDSGQIESINAFAGEDEFDLPETRIAFHIIGGAGPTEALEEIALTEAVDELCYRYLEFEYDGWENNDGAYGEFVFDVAARTITLDFHARFIDATLHQHTF